MTGKEFRKALKELFKKLDLDDKEIHVSSGQFLMFNDVNLSKFDNCKDMDAAWDDRVTYIFRLKDGDDAKTMYAEIRKRNPSNYIKLDE